MVKRVLKSQWVALIVVSAASLTGCASVAHHDSTPPSNEVMASLTDAVNGVSEQLNLLRATSVGQGGQSGKIFPIPHSGALSTEITMQWTGPVEPALRSVAQLVGYNFKVIGQPPPDPILVALDANKKPAFAILQNIGMQTGDGVGVVVNKKSKTIAITYKGQVKGTI